MIGVKIHALCLTDQSHLPCFLRMADDSLHGIGQLLHIPVGDNPSCMSIFDDLSVEAPVGSDDRQAGDESIDENAGKPLSIKKGGEQHGIVARKHGIVLCLKQLEKSLIGDIGYFADFSVEFLLVFFSDGTIKINTEKMGCNLYPLLFWRGIQT